MNDSMLIKTAAGRLCPFRCQVSPRLKMANVMMSVLFLVLSLCAVASAQAPTKVHGCSGRGFTGSLRNLWLSVPELAASCRKVFRTSLVSVKSTGSYVFRLFTSAGCQYHCNDNDNGSRLVDSQGWGNIGAAAYYACVDGPD